MVNMIYLLSKVEQRNLDQYGQQHQQGKKKVNKVYTINKENMGFMVFKIKMVNILTKKICLTLSTWLTIHGQQGKHSKKDK